MASSATGSRRKPPMAQPQPQLARQPAGVRTACPVIDKSKRDDGAFHDDGQVGQRWRDDTALLRQRARLSQLPDQGAMLSKDASSENPTQHLRGGPGRCSWTGQDKGIRAFTPLSQEDRDAVRTPDAFCGLADWDFSVPPARSSSSPWQRLRRTFAGWQS